ncbi:NUDIX hydrolase [Altererythrobacter sp.]|uniref:NUDIX hydrolase n=1 Tax=Altererythrobacter sp. TaxID=1872480 RepID=UPI003CFDA633
MNDTQPVSREGIPAATVVIFRNGEDGQPPELLMTIRSKTMVFAGGMAVFPGGKVDPQDYTLGEQFGGELDVDEAAHQIAVIRETLEETGLAIGLSGEIDAERAHAARARLLELGTFAPVLEEFGWTPDLSQLTPFARWFPRNERIPRVYDTRFYLANLGTGAVDVEADLSENTHLFWTTAQGALNAAAKGDIKVIFPTRRNLERLAQFTSYDEARAHAVALPVRIVSPHIEEREGRPWLCIGEDHGYPVTGEPLDNVTRG